MTQITTFLSMMTLLAGLSTVHAAEAPITSEQLYQQGHDAYNKEQYTQAMNLFNQVKQEYPTSSEAEKSHLSIIQSYIKMEQFVDAELAFAQFMDAYPNSHYADAILEIQKVLADYKQRA